MGVVMVDWKTMREGKEKYSAYLASREWAVLKEQIKQRSRGICEHCLVARGTQTHHQTYARKYKEPLSDLLHVCAPCHEFLSGKSQDNPADTRPLMMQDHEGRWALPLHSVYFVGGDSVADWCKSRKPTPKEKKLSVCVPFAIMIQHPITLQDAFIESHKAVRSASLVFAFIRKCHWFASHEIGLAIGMNRKTAVYFESVEAASAMWAAAVGGSCYPGLHDFLIQPSIANAWDHFMTNYVR